MIDRALNGGETLYQSSRSYFPNPKAEIARALWKAPVLRKLEPGTAEHERAKMVFGLSSPL
jgi:hypothetical protein